MTPVSPHRSRTPRTRWTRRQLKSYRRTGGSSSRTSIARCEVDTSAPSTSRGVLNNSSHFPSPPLHSSPSTSPARPRSLPPFTSSIGETGATGNRKKLFCFQTKVHHFPRYLQHSTFSTFWGTQTSNADGLEKMAGGGVSGCCLTGCYNTDVELHDFLSAFLKFCIHGTDTCVSQVVRRTRPLQSLGQQIPNSAHGVPAGTAKSFS